MDNATAATIYFDFMMNGKIDPVTGEYAIRNLEAEDHSQTPSQVLDGKISNDIFDII